MSKSIWRLRNMACHLTFRQQSRSCPVPGAPAACASLSLPAPLQPFFQLFGCGNTVTFAIATEQKVHIKNGSLFVARCTPLSSLTRCWSCDCIDHWSAQRQGMEGGGVVLVVQRIVATARRATWQMIKASASAWQDNWLAVPQISIKLLQIWSMPGYLFIR